MEIKSFIWDEGNLSHFADNEYGIDPQEVEEIFAPDNLIKVVKHKADYLAYGKTYQDKYLCIPFEYRGNHRARPITGWLLSSKEKKALKNRGAKK